MHGETEKENAGACLLLRVPAIHMSDFKGLKGFALARESAYFKVEQV